MEIRWQLPAGCCRGPEQIQREERDARLAGVETVMKSSLLSHVVLPLLTGLADPALASLAASTDLQLLLRLTRQSAR